MKTAKPRPVKRYRPLALVLITSVGLTGALATAAYQLGVYNGRPEPAVPAPTAMRQPSQPAPSTVAPAPTIATTNPFSERVLTERRPLVQPLAAPSEPPADDDFVDGPEVVLPPAQPPAQPATPPPQAAAPPALPPPPPVLPPANGQPWRSNAVATAWPLQRPAVAIVIDDMGVDRKRSAQMVAMPGPLTLAYLPYGAGVAEQARKARAAGHELMVHMPMEPLASTVSPGPDALLTGLPASELAARLARNLEKFDGYVGVNNHMGSRFTENPALLTLVLVELKRRGLLFLDSRTSPRSVGDMVGQQIDLPHTGRDVFLDHDMTPAAIEAALAKLEQVARRNGTAIAIGHPHDITRQALAAWLPGLPAKGISLVPLSAIVRTRWAPATGSVAEGN